MDEKKQAKPEVTELDPENLEKASGGHGSMNPDGTYNCPRCWISGVQFTGHLRRDLPEMR